MDRFLRNRMLFGNEGQELLFSKKVTVFGVGGVGGYVCEMLARSGVGTIEIVDHDTVSESNINRQIIALSSTVGKDKVAVMETRPVKDVFRYLSRGSYLVLEVYSEDERLLYTLSQNEISKLFLSSKSPYASLGECMQEVAKTMQNGVKIAENR